MSGAEFAGALGERVCLQRRSGERDDLGGAGGAWSAGVTVWAAMAPAGAASWGQGDRPGAAPRWRATIRAIGADVRSGDRLTWRGAAYAIRSVEADPAAPDRLLLTVEEDR
ncbi:phage head completion protein [Sphingomonas sp. PR090111-T3T-6A]|uniref:phage head completion protein n=1 Tax=Sphingomonas sp. PR090111-T3T-6A TaxID=685778 RepID=UPI00037506BB|nr:head-tail adaptor protein [Sphingomonas sp. PR090111-T3T-6A]